LLSDHERNAIEELFGHLPTKHAGAIEALMIVQKQRGFVSDDSLVDIAQLLDMTPAELDGIATFYNLIFRKSVGKHVILACDGVSCWLTGGERVIDHLQKKLGIECGQTTNDGLFTLLPTVCLGHCDIAPAMMLDDKIIGNLTEEKIEKLLGELSART